MTIRWGILGASGIAHRRTMPAIQQAKYATLQALMVRDLEWARKLAEEHGARAYYDRVEDLLADPEVDAVHVATPVYLHRDLVLQAAEHGKHVLCEKPMAMNGAECREMIAACSANGVMLQMGLVLRFHPALRNIREIVRSGQLGMILEARTQLLKWMPRGGNSWRIKPEMAGGGVIMDIGSHAIDLLCYLLGDVAEVIAFTGNRVFGWAVEDTGSVMLRFRDGAWGKVAVSFGVPHAGSFLEVYGTEGTLLVYSDTPHVEGWRVRTYVGGEIKEWEAPGVVLYKELVEHFARAVEGTEEPAAPGNVGLRNVEIMEAAYRSAQEKRVVSVE